MPPSGPEDGARPPGEARALLRLSLPLAAGYAGNQLISFVSTILVGRLGPEELGAVGIGNGLFFALTVAGMGVVLGMDAPVAQAVGAGEEARARRVLWQGVRVALLVGVPLTGLLALAPLVLGVAEVDPATAAEARRYLLGRLPNIVPFLLFSAARSYLQARAVTRPIVAAVVAANVTNVVANWLLIHGDAGLARLGLPAVGLPALGVLGSGLAASLAAIVQLAVLAAGVAAVEAPPDPARRRADRALGRTIFRLGVPLGLQLLAEVGVFAAASVLAGRMSARAAAGHQIAITLASFTFTVMLGAATATAVRVGHHVGRGDTAAARRTGFLGLAIAGLFAACAAAAFVGFPRALGRLITNDPVVIEAAVPLIGIAAVFQLFDATQAVMAAALRGAGDARFPLVANLACHYGLSLPVAVLLGFGLSLGARGLWWGLCLGLVAVGLTLLGRFARLSSRPIARV